MEIKSEYRKWEDVEITHREYRNNLAKSRGFKNNEEYKNNFAKKHGFSDFSEYKKNWNHKTGRDKPMSENPKCSSYLGIYVVEEKLLSHIFKDDIERMPNNNHGFDFICGKGFKIDCKSGVLRKSKVKNDFWSFKISKNHICDYFLCLAFDTRDELHGLNPQHVWLIKADEVIKTLKGSHATNEKMGISIPNTPEGLATYQKYELTDKLKEAIACCNTIKFHDTTLPLPEPITIKIQPITIETIQQLKVIIIDTSEIYKFTSQKIRLIGE